MMNDTPDPEMTSRTATSRASAGSTRAATAARRVHILSDASAPGAARQIVREVATGLAGSLVERAVLAASELVTNAVRHGADTGSMIDLAVERTDAGLIMTVSDSGRAEPAEVDDAGGLGLDIVSQVADELTIDADRGWTVRAVFTPRPTRPSPDDA